MSCQYTNAMKINQNTVAKHFADIQKAVDVAIADKEGSEYEKASTFLKSIFATNSNPHDYIKISIDKEGKINYNKFTQELAIDFIQRNNFKDIITKEINDSILKHEENIFKQKDEKHIFNGNLLDTVNLHLIRTIVKRFLPEENDEIAKKNLKQAEEFIALNTQMNAYVSYWNPQNNAAPLCSYILSCILDYIKKKDNLMYQYYEPEKQAPKGKSHSTNLMLIGGCGSLILLLSAVLYWFYKK